MCNKCIHKVVCSKYIACGEVKACEHFIEAEEGYWIERPLDNFRKYEVKCSRCGWIGIENYDQYVSPGDFNFCPNCGADMRGKENGE